MQEISGSIKLRPLEVVTETVGSVLKLRVSRLLVFHLFITVAVSESVESNFLECCAQRIGIAS